MAHAEIMVRTPCPHVSRCCQWLPADPGWMPGTPPDEEELDGAPRWARAAVVAAGAALQRLDFAYRGGHADGAASVRMPLTDRVASFASSRTSPSVLVAGTEAGGLHCVEAGAEGDMRALWSARVSSAISDVAMDGRRIACACADGAVVVLDAESAARGDDGVSVACEARGHARLAVRWAGGDSLVTASLGVGVELIDIRQKPHAPAPARAAFA